MKIHKQLMLGLILSITLILGLFMIIPYFTKASNIVGPNYHNVTVRTFVNITNAKPEVLSVYVYQDVNYTLPNVTLSAGSLRNVVCNATLRDWNGYNDIVQVNATLWDNRSSLVNATDDNNSHYTNPNCANTGNGVNYTVNYICNFSVYYYANNGTWICNVTDMDTYNKTGSGYNTTVILPLYSLNVTDGINYGNVAVEDFSTEQTANVTNFGNMPINLTLEGYGVTKGDGLAMNCSVSGNISVSNEKFSLVSGLYASKSALTSTSQLVQNLTILKQTISTAPVVNTTYWQLYIPPNPAGNCTGFVIFSATGT